MVRGETFWPYFLGRESLLKDKITAGDGVIVVEEAPFALRRGVPVRRGIEGTIRLTATARGKVVARGKGTGGAPVTLRFTKAGARRLAKVRSVNLTVAVAGHELRRSLTLRR